MLTSSRPLLWPSQHSVSDLEQSDPLTREVKIPVESDSSDGAESGGGAGAVIGAVIGCCFGLALIIAIVVILVLRIQKQNNIPLPKPSPPDLVITAAEEAHELSLCVYTNVLTCEFERSSDAVDFTPPEDSQNNE
jgi:hypothetical protein